MNGRNSMNTRRDRLAACATGLVALGVALPAIAEPAPPKTWNFEVYLDEREIGFHRFDLRDAGEGLRMESTARFEVRFIVVTAFEYDHSNTELWQDGCLERIEARTNSNGKRFSVSGETRGDGFVLATGSGTTRVDECVGSFAYWDRRLLERSRLLNSQTGEYLEVDLDPLPGGSMKIGDREIQVNRYQLSARGMDIRLAYAADSGEWVALDSIVAGGRTLRYRRSPADFMGPAGLALAGTPSATGALR